MAMRPSRRKAREVMSRCRQCIRVTPVVLAVLVSLLRQSRRRPGKMPRLRLSPRRRSHHPARHALCGRQQFHRPYGAGLRRAGMRAGQASRRSAEGGAGRAKEKRSGSRSMIATARRARWRLRRLGEAAGRSQGEVDLLPGAGKARAVPGLYRHAVRAIRAAPPSTSRSFRSTQPRRGRLGKAGAPRPARRRRQRRCRTAASTWARASIVST